MWFAGRRLLELNGKTYMLSSGSRNVKTIVAYVQIRTKVCQIQAKDRILEYLKLYKPSITNQKAQEL